MKKSQIVLGANTLTLAIAAAFVTKASSWDVGIRAAIKSPKGGCQQVGIIFHVTVIQGAHLTARTSLGSTLFTASCTHTLFTSPNN